MDNKKMRQHICLILVLTAVFLTACGNGKNPSALEETTWTDPNPEIRGTIEHGIYKNEWLNLQYATISNSNFLAQYNQISCQAEPDICRWYELYESDGNGNATLLSVEKMPNNTTLDKVALDHRSLFEGFMQNALSSANIPIVFKYTMDNYGFYDNNCILESYTVDTSYAKANLTLIRGWQLFWEKNGFLVTLQLSRSTTSTSTNDYLEASDLESQLRAFSTCTPAETTNTSPGSSVTIDLNAPSAWQMDYYDPMTNECYNASYAFLADGTCQMIFGLENWLLAGYSGTYTIDGNTLTVSITSNGNDHKSYDISYTIDITNQTATQISDVGLVDLQKAGSTFTFKPDTDSTVEVIVDKAVINWDNAGDY